MTLGQGHKARDTMKNWQIKVALKLFWERMYKSSIPFTHSCGKFCTLFLYADVMTSLDVIATVAIVTAYRKSVQNFPHEWVHGILLTSILLHMPKSRVKYRCSLAFPFLSTTQQWLTTASSGNLYICNKATQNNMCVWGQLTRNFLYNKLCAFFQLCVLF